MLEYCSQSRKRSHLKWFEELFIQISGDDEQPIGLEDFKAAVHTEHVSHSSHLCATTESVSLCLHVILSLCNCVYIIMQYWWCKTLSLGWSGYPSLCNDDHHLSQLSQLPGVNNYHWPHLYHCTWEIELWGVSLYKDTEMLAMNNNYTHASILYKLQWFQVSWDLYLHCQLQAKPLLQL